MAFWSGLFKSRDAHCRGRVVVYGGPVDDALPENVLLTGLGGSETAMVKVSEHFARRGYEVCVYAGESRGGLRGDHVTVGGKEEWHGQILYGKSMEWDPSERADLFVSCRYPEAFDATINAPRRLLWLQDAGYGDRVTERRVSSATDVAVVSEFQRGLLARLYPFIDDEKWFVTRNGIETSFYLKRGRKKPIVVYSSSPDRGLDVLLECWPEIHERVPQAELHHACAPVYFRYVLASFQEKIQKLSEAEGVVAHGSLNQKALADLYLQARVWAYPSWNTSSQTAFPETSCISAMEAQAAEAFPVYLDCGALKETVQFGSAIPIRVRNGRLSTAWREEFVEAVVAALEQRTSPPKASRAWALGQDWSGVVDQWEQELLDLAVAST